MKQKKALGQHWLTNRTVLRQIAELAAENLPERNFCLEIGPGLGTLTSALLTQFGEVLAVEFDPDLAAKLPGQFRGAKLTVQQADILSFDLDRLPPDYVVAGNIPYYITAPIVQKFLQARNRPRRMALLVQKEVAERLAGRDGGSLLGLSAYAEAVVTLGPVVRREEFSPPPQVDSQVVVFALRPTSLLPAAAASDFWRLVKLGFAGRRKKLRNNLAPLGLREADYAAAEIDPELRPEKLSFADWLRLFNYVKTKR